jgi:hypothetical protein
MFSSVALYFRVTERASNTISSAHLLPSVFGNAIGSLLAGAIIQRYIYQFLLLLHIRLSKSTFILIDITSTGSYKTLIILAPASTSICYLLLLIRWHGHTSLAESLYIAIGGFGLGISTATVFVFLSASTKKSEAAIAGGGFFLSLCLGEVAGLSAQNAILQITLRGTLEQRLGGVEGGTEASVHLLFLVCLDFFATPNLTLILGLFTDHSQSDCKRQQHLAFAHGFAGDCDKRIHAKHREHTQ